MSFAGGLPFVRSGGGVPFVRSGGVGSRPAAPPGSCSSTFCCLARSWILVIICSDLPTRSLFALPLAEMQLAYASLSLPSLVCDTQRLKKYLGSATRATACWNLYDASAYLFWYISSLPSSLSFSASSAWLWAWATGGEATSVVASVATGATVDAMAIASEGYLDIDLQTLPDETDEAQLITIRRVSST